MCIGIKPVFVPLNGIRDVAADAVKSPSVVTDAVGSSSDVSTSSLDTVVSRKRPLNVEVPVDVSSRKVMRYSSSCTCNCDQDNGDCKRQVRFSCFETHVPAAYSFDEEEAKDLWYSLEDCAELSKVSRMRVKELRSKEENKDNIRHVFAVASQCAYNPPPLAFLNMVRLHFEDDTRGLELSLLPLRMRKRRQEHVKGVVEVQKQIVSGKLSLKNDANVKAKALAIQSLRSSQASALFAELLARNVALDEQEQ